MTHEIHYLLTSLLSSILWFLLGAASMWLYLHPHGQHRKGHRR